MTNTTAPRVNEMLFGAVGDLNAAQRQSIRTIAEHIAVAPNVAIHSNDNIDLVFNTEGRFGFYETQRVTIDADGRMTGFGAGDDWDDDDWDHAMREELTKAGLSA